MKRLFLALALILAPVVAKAQIVYNPGGGGGGGGTFTSPGAGIPVDTDGASTWAARCLAASTGISIANTCGAAGNFTISIDTATTPQFSSGTPSPSAGGSVGTLYFETDRPATFTYPATNTLHWLVSIPGSTSAQGDLIYLSAQDTGARLAKSTLGNQVLSNTGTTNNPAWIQATSSNLTQMDMVEDFCAAGNTNGTIGANGFAGVAIATGTLGLSKGTTTNPCVVRLNSHATNDNSGWILTFNSTVGDSRLNWGTTVWYMEEVIIPGSNSTSIASAALIFGMSSVSAADPNTAGNGAWIRYDTDNADTKFTYVLCNAGGAAGCNSNGDAANADTEDSGVTVVAGTAYLLRIAHDMTGAGATEKYTFTVNGANQKTFCSSGCDSTLAHSPGTNVMTQITSYLTRTTTGVMSADLDYYHFNLQIAARY